MVAHSVAAKEVKKAAVKDIA
jgi:hypothetical protein